MAAYSRKTSLPVAEVLERAARDLPALLGLRGVDTSSHGGSWTGAEGSVKLSVHGHGLYTEVVARTDKLRTSRMDVEVQRFLNSLPYEPYDRGGAGAGALPASMLED